MSRIRQDCAKCNGTGWFYIQDQVTKCNCPKPKKKNTDSDVAVISFGENALPACQNSLPQIRAFLKQSANSKNTILANPRQISLVQTAPLKLRRGILWVETKEQHVYNELKSTSVNVLNLIRQKFKVKKLEVVPPKGLEENISIARTGVHEQNIGEIAIGIFHPKKAKIIIQEPLQKGLSPGLDLVRWYSVPSEENTKIMRRVEVVIKCNPRYGLFTAEDEDFLIVLEAITQEQGIPEKVYFSPYEVLKRAGRPDGGSQYERLNIFLHRAASNLIQYSPMGWYDAESGFWLPKREDQDSDSAVFPMITSFRPLWDKDRSRSGGRLSDKCWIQWSSHFRRNFLAGWVSWKFPLDIYFGLPEGLPRTIYRYAWKRLRGQPGEHREPLLEFYEGRMGLLNGDRGAAYMEEKLFLDRLKYWQNIEGQIKPTHLRGIIDRQAKQLILKAESGFGQN